VSSKRKSSSMGKVELVLKTPLIFCKLLNKAVLDTINFIIIQVIIPSNLNDLGGVKITK
jgi:hypothetical protein